MTDVLTVDEQAQGGEPSVTAEEAAEAAQRAADAAAAATAIAKNPAAPGMVRLFDPDHASLEFGDRHIDGENMIKFGPRGFFEPGVWVGPADHPLLHDLLRKHPHIRSVDNPNKVYACDQCDFESTVKIALNGHKRAKH